MSEKVLTDTIMFSCPQGCAARVALSLSVFAALPPQDWVCPICKAVVCSSEQAEPLRDAIVGLRELARLAGNANAAIVMPTMFMGMPLSPEAYATMQR